MTSPAGGSGFNANVTCRRLNEAIFISSHEEKDIDRTRHQSNNLKRQKRSLLLAITHHQRSRPERKSFISYLHTQTLHLLQQCVMKLVKCAQALLV